MLFINKTITLFFIVLYFFSTNVAGQDSDTVENKAKSGISLGIIPALSYDSDIGLKYGAVINIFDYGTGKNYPAYEQYLYAKLTNTTKKTTEIQLLLESEKIIKKAVTIIEATYLGDIKLDFFGFNGIKTIFNSDFVSKSSDDFRNGTFYSHKRKLFRFRFDIQKYLGKKSLRLLTGVAYNKYKIDLPVSEENIYNNYVNWNIISENEKTGGEILNFSLGIIYDTRNDKCYCTSGNWLETYLVYMPAMFGSKGYLKSIITYRYYKDMLNQRVSFALRLSAQNKIYGTIPFYNLPVYYDSRINRDGLGGAYTLRGISRNRITADGFAISNFEIKAKILNFRLLKQDFMTAVSAFSDIAYITQEYKTNLSGVAVPDRTLFFTNEKQKATFTYGLGFYIIFNKNNAVSVNYGFSPNKQFGSSGLYVGSSLLF